MRLPYLSSYPARQESVISKFMGLNQKLIAADGEFANQKNISDRYYPAISSRKVRGKLGTTLTTPHGLIYKNGLFWVDGTKCYYDGTEIEGLTVTNGDKKLVGMGAYVYIFPDNIRFNTYTKEFEPLGFDIDFHPHFELESTGEEVDMASKGITIGTNNSSGGQIVITASTTNAVTINEITPEIGTIEGISVFNQDKAYGIGINTSGSYQLTIREDRLLGDFYYSIVFNQEEVVYMSEGFDTAAEMKADMQNTVGLTYSSYEVGLTNSASALLDITASSSRSAVLTSQTKTGASVNSATFCGSYPDGVYTFNYIMTDTATFSPLSSGSTFMKITLTGVRGSKILSLLNQSDNVTITGCTDSKLDGTHIVTEKGTDYIVIAAVFSKYWAQTGSATLTPSANTTTIVSENIDKFEVGDTVVISGCSDSEFNTEAEVTAVAENSITVDEAISSTITQTKGLSISLSQIVQTSGLNFSRKIPNLDYICENGNRLYGVDSSEHTVYASKLGDGKNWYNYENTAADAWYSSVGSDGDFTGCVAHMGYTLFMKENNIHVLYGAKPSNFSMTEKQLSGIKNGCDRSAVIINETLYYVGENGVYAYDGSVPYKISEKITQEITDAVASQHNDRYYLSCKLNNVQTLLVYNPITQIWNIEDGEQMKYASYGDGNLFYINQNNRLTAIAPINYSKAKYAQISAYIDETTTRYTLDENTFCQRLLEELPDAQNGRYVIGGASRVGPSSILTIKLNGVTILTFTSTSSVSNPKAHAGYWGLTYEWPSGAYGGTYPDVGIAFTHFNPIYLDLTGVRDEKIDWVLESSDTTESSLNEKHISKFKFNFELDKGSEVNIYISTDDSEYEYKGSIKSVRKTTYTVPIIPKRCNKYRYKLTGKGQFKLLGLSRVIEGGSEINGTVQYGVFR